MLEELKQECFEINQLLPRRGLIQMTFGNAGIIDRARGIFAIKPSGVPYEELKPADMVLMDLEGKKVEGRFNPSSDTPTYVRLFQAFTIVGAIVHTHSKFATAFAQAGRSIPCLGTTHGDFFYGEIPVTRKMRPEEIAGKYEWETGSVIVETFQNRDPLDCSAVLVHSHGPFAWGKTGMKAADNAHAMEIVAEMALASLQINPSVTSMQPELLNKHFRRKHGSGAYYGQAGPCWNS